MKRALFAVLLTCLSLLSCTAAQQAAVTKDIGIATVVLNDADKACVAAQAALGQLAPQIAQACAIDQTATPLIQAALDLAAQIAAAKAKATAAASASPAPLAAASIVPVASASGSAAASVKAAPLVQPGKK
jgi:hypothetical protein